MLKKHERQQEIMNLLNARDFILIKEIYTTLGISQMTARRDVFNLVDVGKVDFVNGIVMKREGFNTERKYHVEMAKDEFYDEKDKIGKYAASLVEPGDTIAIDIGTTAVHMIKYLPDNIDIVVICNALNVLNELRKKNIRNIIFCGGTFRESTQMFESDEGIQLIKKYRVTKAFMSAAGFDIKLGVTCVNMYEVAYKKTIMEFALQKILLIDSSKYNKVRSAYYANAIDFTQIVTTNIFDAEDNELLLQNTKITII